MSGVTVDFRRALTLAPGAVLHRVELAPVSRTQLVYYCAATRVTDPIHFDRAAAQSAGFADVVVNGSLRIAWMVQALHDLVQAPDFVCALRSAHRGPMLVGQALSLEVQVAAAAETSDTALLLPCLVIGRVGDAVVDQAEGALTLLRPGGSA